MSPDLVHCLQSIHDMQVNLSKGRHTNDGCGDDGNGGSGSESSDTLS